MNLQGLFGRRTLGWLAPTSLALALSACSSAPQPAAAAPATPAAAAPEQLDAQRLDAKKLKIAALRAAIVAVARAAQGQCDGDDNSPEVSAVLNTLTDELLNLVPARSEAEKLPQVAGGWKQVWADLQGGGPFCISANDIYQVVSPAGYYWNISKNITPQGAVAGFLRGKYAVGEGALRIEFTAQAISPVYPPAGTRLDELAARAERGEFPRLPPGPPVGVKGDLQNTYVDSQLRIVRGRDDRPGSRPSLFVLLRADTIR